MSHALDQATADRICSLADRVGGLVEFNRMAVLRAAAPYAGGALIGAAVMDKVNRRKRLQRARQESQMIFKPLQRAMPKHPDGRMVAEVRHGDYGSAEAGADAAVVAARTGLSHADARRLVARMFERVRNLVELSAR